MQILRSPCGCPWDREQTLRSLAPYVLEEAAEVIDAIETDRMPALCEEVGDLIFEGVFLAQVASEAGHFTVGDALRTVTEKLIRRHPHVFSQAPPDGTSAGPVETPSEVVDQWHRIKAREKAGRPEGDHLLDGVANALPALAAAHAIGQRVARVGFDWPSPASVIDKVAEELEELRDALSADEAPAASRAVPTDQGERLAEELGDLLFSVAQLARQLGIDPEAALRAANRKFRRRFDALEDEVRRAGQSWASLTPEDLEAYWATVKATE